MKKTYYFSHDYNSFFDPKIRYIVSRNGMMAYGIFWLILEMMASEKDYKIRKQGFNFSLHPLIQGKHVNYSSEHGIGGFKDDLGETVLIEDAHQLSISLAQLQALLEDCFEIGLFQEDGTYFWSNSLIERMEKREEETNKKKMAGYLGGKASASKRNESKEQASLKQHNKQNSSTNSSTAQHIILNEMKLNENKNDLKTKAKSLETTKTELSTEARQLSSLLLSNILSNNPKFTRNEKTLDLWAESIDKMIRIDKRDPKEIEFVILWCQKDPFWKGNILSGEKLRKQYDQLWIKIKSNYEKNKINSY